LLKTKWNLISFFRMKLNFLFFCWPPHIKLPVFPWSCMYANSLKNSLAARRSIHLSTPHDAFPSTSWTLRLSGSSGFEKRSGI
jgi:hypothetical protein